MRWSNNDIRGFTLVELVLVVAIVGILLAIALPNFTTSRNNTYKAMCINNLRKIELAKEQWALECSKDIGDTPLAADLDTYVMDGTSSLACPVDANKTFSTSYAINAVGTHPDCKISPGDHKL